MVDLAPGRAPATTRARRTAAHIALWVSLVAGLPASALAQDQAPTPPADPEPADARAVSVRAPGAVAIGGVLRATARGLRSPVRVEVRRRGVWRPAGTPARVPGAVMRVRAPDGPGTLRIRARGSDGAVSRSRQVRVRALTLAAVGDVNLGDRPGQLMEQFGYAYPWTSVGPTLRRADLSLANLECAVSRRGTPQDKQYVFRGRPEALRAMSRSGGIDVVNLANNHAGDFGDDALLDTLRNARSLGMTPVGAGATETAAYRPQVLERLGLRVAFVGFSTILPFEFRAVDNNPGTAWGFADRVRRSVQQARRQADVVVATFHWGIERDTVEDERERALARVALDAGATVIIGGHPHVLQPIRRPTGRLVAYSLGNFVFGAGSPGTASTGILQVGLGRGRVVSARLLRADIRATRPVLRGGG